VITANAKIVVEKDQPGQPHRGKVFVAVHARGKIRILLGIITFGLSFSLLILNLPRDFG